MNNLILKINTTDADAIAESYFKNICGFDRPDILSSPRTGGMLREAFAVRERIRDGVDLRAVVSSLDRDALSDGAIQAGSATFRCNAFEHLDRENILRIYAFILTAGSFMMEQASTLEKFYADAWGTAYVDAGRDILRRMLVEVERKILGEDKDFWVSDPFGPGFHGMGIDQLAGFFSLLDAGKIQVRLTDSNCILPLKSCTGFYIVTDQPGQLPYDGCRSCLAGDGKCCSHCRNTKISSENMGDMREGDLL